MYQIVTTVSGYVSYRGKVSVQTYPWGAALYQIHVPALVPVQGQGYMEF